MATKSSKNEMFVFGLCSTSENWLSDMSDESCLKCQKMATKSSENEMFVFGLHSTSDDRPSDESHLKCKKMATKSSKNEKQFTHPPDEMGME